MDTTRRYPRTLREAFPRDAQHAYAIERYRPISENLVGIFLACAIGIAFGLSLVVWWSEL